MTTTTAAPITLLVRLPHGAAAPSPGPVLAAIAQLFDADDPVHVVYALDRQPTPQDAQALAARCAAVVDLSRLPTTDLVGPDELAGLQPLLEVTDGGDDAEVARAVVLLATLARTVAEPRSAVPAPRRPTAAVPAGRVQRDARRRTRPQEPVRLLVPVQHLNTWAAQAPVVAAALAHPRVQVDVVALDSVQSRRPGETADFLHEHGVETRDEQWGARHADRADIVLLVDPYDEFRPAGLRASDALAAGVRVVYSPYAHNIGGDPEGLARQYDTPLHRQAWRVFVPSPVQRDMYAQHCSTGTAHVRCLGSVKAEWLVGSEVGAPWTTRWSFHRTVLWNPHFNLGPGGWSTFFRYADDLIGLAVRHPGTGFVVRPHFRLLPELQSAGGDAARFVASFRAACRRLPNVHLDEDRDYRPALQVADAMLSDLSSLIPEFLELGRPVGYLAHPDYRTPGADDDWLPDVRTITDADGVAAFVADAEAGRLTQPRPRPDPRGAGARVVDAVVGDFVQEVFGA